KGGTYFAFSLIKSLQYLGHVALDIGTCVSSSILAFLFGMIPVQGLHELNLITSISSLYASNRRLMICHFSLARISYFFNHATLQL
ncbi:MAG: hypothetical protein EBZ93_14200, partial [Actinobacteria bacterium]|nr:hypothetical protein [Actinomycetota bacterium]